MGLRRPVNLRSSIRAAKSSCWGRGTGCSGDNRPGVLPMCRTPVTVDLADVSKRRNSIAALEPWRYSRVRVNRECSLIQGSKSDMCSGYTHNNQEVCSTHSPVLNHMTSAAIRKTTKIFARRQGRRNRRHPGSRCQKTGPVIRIQP